MSSAAEANTVTSTTTTNPDQHLLRLQLDDLRARLQDRDQRLRDGPALGRQGAQAAALVGIAGIEGRLQGRPAAPETGGGEEATHRLDLSCADTFEQQLEQLSAQPT